MRSPRLIILNGFAASGKSTIAKKFIQNHPLSLLIEGDEIISMIGGWKDNYEDARNCVFPHTKAMVETHLSLGCDVIVPYLLVNADEAEQLETIAREQNARFFEIFLSTSKEKAIERLMERGSWGEEGLPKLTDKDLPEIRELYSKMEKATSQRKSTHVLEVDIGDIDNTYKKFLELVN